MLAASILCCSGNPTTPAIGYASDPDRLNSGSVAQADYDLSRHRGDLPIRITTATPVTGAPHLVEEVDQALDFRSDPSMVAVVGPGGSREALQTAPIYRDAQIPNIIPTSTSHLLKGIGPWAFLLAPDDSLQGEFIAGYAAQQLHARSALILYVPDEYGLGLAGSVHAALNRRDIPVLAQIPIRSEQSCPLESSVNGYSDMVAAALLDGVPDLVVLATRTRDSACIARAMQARVAGVRFVAGDGTLVDSAFIALAGRATDSMAVVVFWHSDKDDLGSRAFARRFRAIVGREARSDDAMYYDAVMVVVQAIRTAGPSRAAIGRYLAELGRTQPPYEGVTGPIAFTPGSPRPMLMTRIRHGRDELVPVP
ncbi:MAG: ABC transporter substrate-binding protein [Gemmatimonadota bacterium]